MFRIWRWSQLQRGGHNGQETTHARADHHGTEGGTEIIHGNHFWFSWVVFRPDTEIWRGR